MPIRGVVTVALVYLSAACASEPAVDVLAEREALRDAAGAYHQAVNSGDVRDFAAFYADGGALMPPNSPAITGEAGIQQYAEGFRAITDFRAEAELLTVEVASGGDMGYTIARVVVTGMDGETPVRETLRDVHLWTRDADGEWKIVVDVWNSLEPADGME